MSIADNLHKMRLAYQATLAEEIDSESQHIDFSLFNFRQGGTIVDEMSNLAVLYGAGDVSLVGLTTIEDFVPVLAEKALAAGGYADLETTYADFIVTEETQGNG